MDFCLDITEPVDDRWVEIDVWEKDGKLNVFALMTDEQGHDSGHIPVDWEQITKFLKKEISLSDITKKE